jgi:peroxiredoxin
MIGCVLAALVAAQDGELDRILLRFSQRRERVRGDAEFARVLAETRAELDAFVKAHPAHADAPRAAFHAAETRLSGREYPAAAAGLEAFLQAHPGSDLAPTALLMLGEARLQMDAAEPARAAYAEFLERFPTEPRTLHARLCSALALQHLRRWDEAAAAYAAVRKEAAGRPESWSAAMQSAVLFHAQEKHAEARTLLEEVAAGCPDRDAAAAARRHLAAYLSLGKPAPAFAERDGDGREQSLEALRGKVVVIYFFDPALRTAVEEAVFLATLRGEGLARIGVCVSPDRRELPLFRSQFRIDWPLVWDPKGFDGRPARAFDVRGLPALWVVDRKGVLRFHNLQGPDLRQAVAKLLEEK